MSKTVCIFPKDETTDFLVPLYELLCSKGVDGWHEDTVNNVTIVIDMIRGAEEIIFLGHGSSGTLYGSPVNGELSELITQNNVHELLAGKKCFLLSCNSEEFCSNYNLSDSIGFGNMPTGMRDVFMAMDNDVSFPNLEQEDIDVYNNALIRALTRAFNTYSLDNIDSLYAKICLYANFEITECLTRKTCQMYREVAELLQDLKNECRLYK